MEYQYQSPWFIEALQKEDNLEVNQLDLNLNADICIIGCLLYTSPSPRD